MHQESINHRELLKGTLSTIILQLLEDNKRLYGYEITQLVKTRTENKVLIKEGSLYPALHKLEAEGYITSEEVYTGKRVRKYYSLTAPGKNMAQASVNELLSFMKTIQELIIPPAHVPA
jgi:PadR family transcriptional regulator PadR